MGGSGDACVAHPLASETHPLKERVASGSTHHPLENRGGPMGGWGSGSDIYNQLLQLYNTTYTWVVSSASPSPALQSWLSHDALGAVPAVGGPRTPSSFGWTRRRTRRRQRRRLLSRLDMMLRRIRDARGSILAVARLPPLSLAR